MSVAFYKGYVEELEEIGVCGEYKVFFKLFDVFRVVLVCHHYTVYRTGNLECSLYFGEVAVHNIGVRMWNHGVVGRMIGILSFQRHFVDLVFLREGSVEREFVCYITYDEYTAGDAY